MSSQTLGTQPIGIVRRVHPVEYIKAPASLGTQLPTMSTFTEEGLLRKFLLLSTHLQPTLSIHNLQVVKFVQIVLFSAGILYKGNSL